MPSAKPELRVVRLSTEEDRQLALAVMREAVRETVQRGFTHYLTDVFEGETHSPYEFHTRVLGFEVVATHEVGELNCPNRRITLLLDIPRNMKRLRASGNWLYRYVTEDWSREMKGSLGLQADPASAVTA